MGICVQEMVASLPQSETLKELVEEIRGEETVGIATILVRSVALLIRNSSSLPLASVRRFLSHTCCWVVGGFALQADWKLPPLEPDPNGVV